MLKLSLSFSDFLVKLIKKDKGKTNAALPMSTRANNTELTLTDVPGLHKIRIHKISTIFH
jgi:predicted CopG family antitoxin